MTADGATGGDDGSGRAVWPPGSAAPAASSVDAHCAACGLGWRIDAALAGYRLRCRCGAWIDVPARAAGRLPGPQGAALARAETAFPAIADDDSAPAKPRPRELARVRSWDGGPLRPDPGGGWSLTQAAASDRAQWTNRTVLELALVLACFWGPALALQFGADGARRAVAMPLAAVASSVLVLLLAGTWRARAFEGLRGARATAFAESAAVAAGFALLAIGWVRLIESSLHVEDDLGEIRSALGLPVALLVVSLAPGIFEEIAFRGLLHARLRLLLGPAQGALVGGAAFALAHGVTAGLPFHWAIGVYLTFLRDRTGSLLPGMACHALYNAILVVALS